MPWAMLRGQAAGLMLLALAGSGMPAAAQTAPDIAPGTARIWFYRTFSPAEPMTSAAVRIDGQIAWISVPGRRFHSDVAPGTYHLSVDSFGQDVNQDKDVALAGGQEFYVKIASLRGWSTQFTYQRDTLYIWPVSPAVARAELAQTAD